MDETIVTIRTTDDETIYYAIADQRPERVRSAIAPILKQAGVPFYDEAIGPATASGQDLADKLRKLAALRDEGILTEDEFATQKARLLSG